MDPRRGLRRFEFYEFPREIRDETYRYTVFPANFLVFPFGAVLRNFVCNALLTHPNQQQTLYSRGPALYIESITSQFRSHELLSMAHEYRYWTDLTAQERQPFSFGRREINQGLLAASKQVHREAWDRIFSEVKVCIASAGLVQLFQPGHAIFRQTLHSLFDWMSKFRNPPILITAEIDDAQMVQTILDLRQKLRSKDKHYDPSVFLLNHECPERPNGMICGSLGLCFVIV